MKFPSTGERVGPAVTVDRWYDRSSRSWVVQAKDANGNQVGDSVYSGTAAGAIAAEHEMKKEIKSRGKLVP